MGIARISRHIYSLLGVSHMFHHLTINMIKNSKCICNLLYVGSSNGRIQRLQSLQCTIKNKILYFFFSTQKYSIQVHGT